MPTLQPVPPSTPQGEINTLLGNRAWMQAREPRLPAEMRPVIWDEGSDSTSLDEALHLLERNGRNVLHSLSVLMPAAWEGNAGVSPEVQASEAWKKAADTEWTRKLRPHFRDHLRLVSKKYVRAG